MAQNDPDNPDLARERQDVDAPPRSESHGRSHFGRGTCFSLFHCEKRMEGGLEDGVWRVESWMDMGIRLIGLLLGGAANTAGTDGDVIEGKEVEERV